MFGKFFDPKAEHDYRQVGGESTNQMVNGLNYFDPWGYKQKAGPVEKGYKKASQQFFDGMTPFDQISGIAPTLSAINNTYANGNRLIENALTSGSGAFGDGDLARDKMAQLTARNAQQESNDKLNAVSNYRQEATQGYQQARGQRNQEALAAGALGLQGKQSALQGYLNSFRGPTSQGSSPFGIIKDIAGLAAAPFTGGASLQSGGAGGPSNLTSMGGSNVINMFADKFKKPKFQYGGNESGGYGSDAADLGTNWFKNFAA